MAQRLPVGDVLEGATLMSSRSYLNDRWKATVLPALKYLCKNRCQLCGRTDRPLEGHHNNYEAVGQERPEDVIILCTHHHALYEWWEKHGNDLGLFDWLEHERQRAHSLSVRLASVGAWHDGMREEIRHANDLIEATLEKLSVMQELKDVHDRQRNGEREQIAFERGERWLSSPRLSRKEAMENGSIVGWQAQAAVDEWSLLVLTAVALDFPPAPHINHGLGSRWARWESLYRRVLTSDGCHLLSLKLTEGVA